jgi:hypothetical protein
MSHLRRGHPRGPAQSATRLRPLRELPGAARNPNPLEASVTNYLAWKFWTDNLVLLVVIANALYTWWSNREKVTSSRFAALEKEVSERLKKTDLAEANARRDKQCAEHKTKTEELHRTYSALHIEVTKLPDRREITNLDNSMKKLSEKIGNLEGRLSGVNRAVDLINEFLIEQGGKK